MATDPLSDFEPTSDPLSDFGPTSDPLGDFGPTFDPLSDLGPTSVTIDGETRLHIGWSCCRWTTGAAPKVRAGTAGVARLATI